MAVVGPQGKAQRPGQGQGMGVFRVATPNILQRGVILTGIPGEVVNGQRQEFPRQLDKMMGQSIFFGHKREILLYFMGIVFGHMDLQMVLDDNFQGGLAYQR